MPRGVTAYYFWTSGRGLEREVSRYDFTQCVGRSRAAELIEIALRDGSVVAPDIGGKGRVRIRVLKNTPGF